MKRRQRSLVQRTCVWSAWINTAKNGTVPTGNCSKSKDRLGHHPSAQSTVGIQQCDLDRKRQKESTILLEHFISLSIRTCKATLF